MKREKGERDIFSRAKSQYKWNMNLSSMRLVKIDFSELWSMEKVATFFCQRISVKKKNQNNDLPHLSC